MIVRRPPFPGMDPWLEEPSRWQGFHNRLIAAIADDLSPRLRPRYYVDVEQRSFLWSAEQQILLGRPDAQIASSRPERPGTPWADRQGVVALAVADDAEFRVRELDIPHDETIQETYLEILDVSAGEVVTILEILSPWNKAGGRGRDDYFAKRAQILETKVNFVEIDLLRTGLPFIDGPITDYRVLIRRGARPRRGTAYEFSYKAAIPKIPIPLKDPDPDVPLELNRVLHDLGDRAGFYLVTDYDRPPVPPLRPADADWAAAILRQAETPIAGAQP